MRRRFSLKSILYSLFVAVFYWFDRFEEENMQITEFQNVSKNVASSKVVINISTNNFQNIFKGKWIVLANHGRGMGKYEQKLVDFIKNKINIAILNTDGDIFMTKFAILIGLSKKTFAILNDGEYWITPEYKKINLNEYIPLYKVVDLIIYFYWIKIYNFIQNFMWENIAPIILDFIVIYFQNSFSLIG
ncbi:hypothetical protein EDEG_00513 [Edhazardia aedis USNM 41457]|uniref:Uncharacterized protein n=1 Tax=Edhazardia aedis (strain USNM 41457) TaxID=1003232 RepID=J9D099_EDHAE|nr:hypothetical protein EDEG_00513 [Edhazardia aedis USNM 41457]|eukprot:EJW01296.1 hypothetical protein EDEG_00513 [Edhazardia aedis USNM 41457]